MTFFTSSDDPDGSFNEYEIIKLISLYDGRAENTGPYREMKKGTHIPDSEKKKLAQNITFEYHSTDGEQHKDLHIIDLMKRLVDSCTEEKNSCLAYELRSGTIQLLLGNTSDSESFDTKKLLWDAIRARTEQIPGNRQTGGDRADPHEATREVMTRNDRSTRTLQALSGIAIGIFDFDETDFEEIVDTFEPSFEDGSVFLKFNRCTLLSIAEGDRALETCRQTLGVSPYLVIPHAVLIHNEELVQMAEAQIEALREKLDKYWQLRLLLKMRDLEARHDTAYEYLHSLHLPMIFNYPTETTLFEVGRKKRGSIEKYRLVQSRLLELHEEIKEIWQLRRGTAEALVVALLAFISATQAARAILEKDIPPAQAAPMVSWKPIDDPAAHVTQSIDAIGWSAIGFVSIVILSVSLWGLNLFRRRRKSSG
ncbi:hypothetical protein [Nitrosovibrio sp. Nv17]|uniref:hypothetical protein n=1 Tax=Nitrosovibrio sp. Nv17 TaxID=1855339 RepID=UPI001160A6CF|nr:hypothetical protein [Nitrosovibrio sp. Nv17]